jgi:hypothetical protein
MPPSAAFLFEAPPVRTPATSPVLHLIQIQRGKLRAVFDRKPSGYEGFFCSDLPSPQVSVAISGKLMVDDNGVRRAITPLELKKWQPKGIVNRVYTGRGVSASTSWATRIKRDGSFTTESTLVVDPGTRRIRVLVTLDLQGGRQITAEAVYQQSDLDCFLALTDSYEGRRPIGLVDGVCQVAGGHFEFLSSVRKMFQPAPGSPLTAMFDKFLYRTRKICKLADISSAAGRYIRSFEELGIGTVRVDIGHVLVGIEASRRQKPASVYPWVPSDATTEALMTWAGDLGSALEPYAEAIVAGRQVDFQTYLKKANVADLLGDVDGINIGSVYDETTSLSANLRKYYETRPFRRFRQFLPTLTDNSGKPLFRLAQQNPPRFDQASRAQAAHYIGMFARGAVIYRKVLDRLTQAQQVQLTAMLLPGSNEMNRVIDYFFAFLEAGLANEP